MGALNLYRILCSSSRTRTCKGGNIALSGWGRVCVGLGVQGLEVFCAPQTDIFPPKGIIQCCGKLLAGLGGMKYAHV